MAKTQIVCSAGIAQATKWNRCDLFSMASWPHFKPAAKNQASAKHAHQANAAMQQKYNAINSTVHDVDWRCPCNRWQTGGWKTLKKRKWDILYEMKVIKRRAAQLWRHWNCGAWRVSQMAVRPRLRYAQFVRPIVGWKSRIALFELFGTCS